MKVETTILEKIASAFQRALPILVASPFGDDGHFVEILLRNSDLMIAREVIDE